MKYKVWAKELGQTIDNAYTVDAKTLAQAAAGWVKHAPSHWQEAIPVTVQVLSPNMSTPVQFMVFGAPSITYEARHVPTTKE